ncbi:hypothetical protein Huta_0799 [Halorhabdus utahensis DSM 12940]|uniref:Envelope protein N-terminal domain-containing protein n=1 Tax=Halorhabdus utahensis (strain DSM 12940 / JCM 11049 / AX-2) TaxID=519442 RepID=C7NU87_HALUD|nr:hypothetical protein [Halorhabdus utahensis]ACV10984.1 hypothetical protein Huta_0799 [Halorhabdus utahensis DSM 12940]
MGYSKHIAAIALIALLVVSPIASMLAVPGPGPVGTASASDDRCHPGIWPLNPGYCIAQEIDYSENDSVSEYSSKLDAYRDAKSIEAQTKTALQQAENSVHDAENQAWLEAEQAFLEAYMNGDSLSTSKQAGVDAMKSHYTVRQTALAELQNNFVASLYGYQNSSSALSRPGDVSSNSYGMHTYQDYPAIQLKVNITDYTESYSDQNYNTQHPPGEPIKFTADILGTESKSVSLLDGSTKPMIGLDLSSDAYYVGSNDDFVKFRWFESNPKMSSVDSSYYLIDDTGSSDELALTYTYDSYDPSTIGVWGDISDIKANLYPDDYPITSSKQTHIASTARFGQLWQDYIDSYNQQSSAFETWADGSYTALENGTISAEDVLSRLNQMQMAADIDWQNATFNDGVVALSSMGLAAPSGSTAYMNLSYQTSFNGSMQTTTGLLMSQTNPPNGTWTRGLTYNSTMLDGSQIIMHLDGNQSSVRGDFRINGAYDVNGTLIEGGNISVDQATYQATNLTDLRNEVLNLSERIGELRNQSLATAGGGGSFAWPDMGIPNPFAALGAVGQWITLFGVLFVALLLLSVVS